MSLFAEINQESRKLSVKLKKMKIIQNENITVKISSKENVLFVKKCSFDKQNVSKNVFELIKFK